MDNYNISYYILLCRIFLVSIVLNFNQIRHIKNMKNKNIITNSEMAIFGTDFKDFKFNVIHFRIYQDGNLFKLVQYGYKLMNIRTKNIVYPSYQFINKKVHRLLAEQFIPNPENKPFVDHINRDKTDYRLENLRWVSYQENTWNRTKKKNATSKYFGVHKCENYNKYCAQITFNKKMYCLGYFDNEIDAAKAYNKKAKEFGIWTRNEF